MIKLPFPNPTIQDDSSELTVNAVGTSLKRNVAILEPVVKSNIRIVLSIERDKIDRPMVS